VAHGDTPTWRIFYRLDPDAILVPHWFAKKDEKTPKGEIALCQGRLRAYDEAVAAAAKAVSKGKKATRRKT
jgi:phage-related protein